MFGMEVSELRDLPDSGNLFMHYRRATIPGQNSVTKDICATIGTFESYNLPDESGERRFIVRIMSSPFHHRHISRNNDRLLFETQSARDLIDKAVQCILAIELGSNTSGLARKLLLDELDLFGKQAGELQDLAIAGLQYSQTTAMQVVMRLSDHRAEKPPRIKFFSPDWDKDILEAISMYLGKTLKWKDFVARLPPPEDFL
ncbi:uncharacterized protein B0I36DRAFT_342936 [Microdochium trichocladiopsis]|uniref:Uncharacterized protein n=1 Tax=Microdochium trichocladiopsis TaxID=1682393 RepID=A0A9P8XPF5_9PEZI|nr:uncharacterized protein B0I36DRAFT_342936 [Microdochium trichocladiopsis]KAH7009104.1 hypothetical protein B0I36DRAFT_342936 [Microdochium trichocladiopsis]